MSDSVSQLQALATADAEEYGIPVDLFLTRIAHESSWNPAAINPITNATGLGQITPATGSDPGYGIAPIADPLDPSQNLSFSAQLLAAYYKSTGSWSGALAKYTGQPSSNFTQYDSEPPPGVTSTSTSSDTYDPTGGYLTPGSPNNVFTGDPLGVGMVGSSSAAGGTWSQWLDTWLLRMIVVCVGIVILLGGLMLLSSQESGVTSKVVPVPV